MRKNSSANDQGSHEFGIDQVIPVNGLGQDATKRSFALFGIDGIKPERDA